MAQSKNVSRGLGGGLWGGSGTLPPPPPPPTGAELLSGTLPPPPPHIHISKGSARHGHHPDAYMSWHPDPPPTHPTPLPPPPPDGPGALSRETLLKAWGGPEQGLERSSRPPPKTKMQAFLDAPMGPLSQKRRLRTAAPFVPGRSTRRSVFSRGLRSVGHGPRRSMGCRYCRAFGLRESVCGSVNGEPGTAAPFPPPSCFCAVCLGVMF